MIKKNHTKSEELTPDSVHAGYTFVQISVSDVDHYKFQKGDIAVFVPFNGKKNIIDMGIYRCIMEKFGFLTFFKKDLLGRVVTTQI